MINESILKKDFTEIKDFFSEETKNHALIRFFLLILFVIAYFLFETYKLGLDKGFLVSLLTWAFFVLCTPIADAGFLLAFPIRLLMGIRMVYTQIFAYILAVILVAYTFMYSSQMFSETVLLKLFKQILTTPYPYWAILIISFIGTIFSIVFGDELIDVSTHKERKKYHKHKKKYRMIATIFMVVMTITLYYFLINQIGVQLFI